jgi:hypothetical protein
VSCMIYDKALLASIRVFLFYYFLLFFLFMTFKVFVLDE